MDNAFVGLIVVGIVLVLAFSFFNSSPSSGGFGFPFLSSSNEPLATGAGTSEIQNPQPARGENEGSFFRFLPSSPRVAGAQNPPQPSPTPTPALSNPPPQNTKPGYSRYEKAVRITRIERSAKTPSGEYIELQNGRSYFGTSGNSETITVTGWSIETRTGARFTIPTVLNIPLIDADAAPIRLPTGGTVIISTSANQIGRNFRENTCTGYFNELYLFVPVLDNSCADDDPEVSILLNHSELSSSCIDFIRNIPECRLPKYTASQETALGPACIGYANNNYSYSGCVKNFRDSADFLNDAWRVFIGSTGALYDPIHDRITLRDEQGLIVDVFEY